MFADIVPEQLRSTVYAFDRSFEGAVAACAAPLVGRLLEQLRVLRLLNLLLSVVLLPTALSLVSASADDLLHRFC